MNMDQEGNFLELNSSRLFSAWLSASKVSVVFTTYQAGKIFFIGTQSDGRLSVFERTFERPMGLGVSKNRLWMSSAYQLWCFENFLEPGQLQNQYDALYVPVIGHTTGDLDIHDIQEDADGNPVFVATRFNCLATPSKRSSFREIWRPFFIDRLAAEDRCHLNGLAMRGGRPAYVTCLSRTNVFEGWREKRRDGGLVIDVDSGEILAEGLSMPHSPRIHNNALWILQAGTGELGKIDLNNGQFEAVCFLPGFARGLAFIGNYAVVGLSRPRENRTFAGLELNERLDAEGISSQCAICIVNLVSGDIEHRLEISGVVEEIYDVTLLPGVVRPMALGFRNEEIRFAIKPEPLSAAS